jgi:hypothetical protein
MEAHGYGILTKTNGTMFKGQWVKNLKHGEGVETFANGDEYKGSYAFNKRSG